MPRVERNDPVFDLRLLQQVEKCGGTNTLLYFEANGLIELRISSLQSPDDGSCPPTEIRTDQVGIGVLQIRVRKIRIQPVEDFHAPA